MKKSTQAKATAREHRKELVALRRERKTAGSSALREITALRKRADKLVASHRESDAKLARRIAILETRLG